MVALEGDQVLVAGVGVDDQPRVVRPDQRVVVRRGEERGHEAGGCVVDGPALVNVEGGALAHLANKEFIYRYILAISIYTEGDR